MTTHTYDNNEDGLPIIKKKVSVTETEDGLPILKKKTTLSEGSATGIEETALLPSLSFSEVRDGIFNKNKSLPQKKTSLPANIARADKDVNSVVNRVKLGIIEPQQLSELYQKEYGKPVIDQIINEFAPEVGGYGLDADVYRSEEKWKNIARLIKEKNRGNAVVAEAQEMGKIDNDLTDAISNFQVGVSYAAPELGGEPGKPFRRPLPNIDINNKEQLSKLYDNINQGEYIVDADGNGVRGMKDKLLSQIQEKLKFITSQEGINPDVASLSDGIKTAVERVNRDREQGEKIADEDFLKNDDINSEHFQLGLSYIKDLKPAMYENIVRTITDKRRVSKRDFSDVSNIGQQISNMQKFRGAASDPTLIDAETDLDYTTDEDKKSEYARIIGERAKEAGLTNVREFTPDQIRSLSTDLPNKKVVDALIKEEQILGYDAIPKSGAIEALAQGVMQPFSGIESTLNRFGSSPAETYLRSKRLDVGIGGQKTIDEKGETGDVLPSDRGNVFYDAMRGFGQFIPQVILTKGIGGVANKTLGLTGQLAQNVTNYGGTIASTYLQTYGDAYESALQKTGDVATARLMGGIDATASALFETILPETKIADAAFRGLKGELASDIVSLMRKGGDPAKLAAKARPYFQRFATNALNIIGQEEAEELGTNIASYLNEAIFSPQTVTDRNLSNELWETGKATAVALAIPAILGGGGAALNKDFTKDAFTAAAINFDDYKNALQEQLDNDAITQDEFNKSVSLLKTHQQSLDAAPKQNIYGNLITGQQQRDYAYEDTKIKVYKEKAANTEGVAKEMWETKIKQSEDIQRAILMPKPAVTQTTTVSTPEGTTTVQESAELTPKETAAVDALKGKDFSQSGVGEFLAPLQDENSTPQQKREALKFLHGQLTAPNTEITTGDLLGKEADVVYNLNYEPPAVNPALAETLKFPARNDDFARQYFTKEEQQRYNELADREDNAEAIKMISDKKVQITKEASSKGVKEAKTASFVSPILERINNADYINEKDLDEAADELYTRLEDIQTDDTYTPEQRQNAENLIEPLIQKIEGYEFRTKTEVGKTTETKTTQVARPAKERSPIKPALEKATQTSVTVTSPTGQKVSGVLNLENGNYIVTNENGDKVAALGEKAINDRDLTFPTEEEMENPIEFGKDGNVKSVTVKTRNGSLITLTNPEVALDLAIQLRADAIGEVSMEEFDTIYETIEKEGEPKEVLVNQENETKPKANTENKQGQQPTEKKVEPIKEPIKESEKPKPTKRQILADQLRNILGDGNLALPLNTTNENEKNIVNKQKKEIEKQLDEIGVDYSFSSYSKTKYGLSIYYDIEEKKARFSDHSVTNTGRMADEMHFSLPFQKTIGIGGVIKDIYNDNKKLYQLRGILGGNPGLVSNENPFKESAIQEPVYRGSTGGEYSDGTGAVYFTSNKDYADLYTVDFKEGKRKDGAKISEYFVNLENPLIIETTGPKGEVVRRAIEEAKNAGHDGIIVRDPNDHSANEIVVFDKSNTKKIKETVTGYDAKERELLEQFEALESGKQKSKKDEVIQETNIEKKASAITKELGIKEGDTIEQVLDKLIAYDGELTPILNFLKGLPDIGTVKFQKLANIAGRQGEYVPESNKQEAPENRRTVRLGQTDNPYYAAVHEIMHFLTLDSDQVNKYADKQKLAALKTIYDFVANQKGTTANTMAQYGLTDFREFMVELAINPEFRKEIADVAASREDFKKAFDLNNPTPDNILTVIKDFITDLIQKIFQGSNYNDVIDHDKSLLDNAVALATEVFFAGNDVISSQQQGQAGAISPTTTTENAALPSNDAVNKFIKNAIKNGQSIADIEGALVDNGYTEQEAFDLVSQNKPQRTNERSFSNQVANDEDILPGVKKGVNAAKEYLVESNYVSAQEAAELIRRVGEDEAYRMITQDETMKPGVRVIVGQALIKNYNEYAAEALKDNDNESYNHFLDKTIATANFVSEKLGTEAGRMIQAFSLYERLTPAAQLRSAATQQREIGKSKAKKVKKQVDIIAQKLRKANEDAADELTGSDKITTIVNKSKNRIQKSAEEKAKKAREKRKTLLDKYKNNKGGGLTLSTGGLSKEGIEYVGELIKTYIDEGLANVQQLVGNVIQHLQDAGVTVTPELTEFVTGETRGRIVNTGAKDVTTEVGKIVRQFYKVPIVQAESLKNQLISRLNMADTDAKELANDIQTKFDEIVKAKKDKIINDEKKRFEKIREGLGGNSKKTTKEVQDDIIKYSNLGAFSDESLLDYLSEKLDLTKLSKEHAAKIIELSERIQKAPEGTPKRNATEDLLAYKAKMSGTSVMEVVQAVWYANILSGVNTHLVNVVSTFFNGMSFFAAEAFRNPLSIPVLFYGGLRGLNRGRFEAANTITTGRSPIHIYKAETPPTLERFSFVGGGFNPGNWLKFVTRLMAAEDVLSFQALKEMRATQLAYNEARKLGLKNPFSKKVWEEINKQLLNTPERSEAAANQATLEGLKKGTRAYKTRIYELMENSRPIEMTDAAYGFAAKGTFNHETEGSLGAITTAISQALDINVGGARPLRFVVPFTRIITNVVNNALDFGPVGLIRAARGVRGFKSFEKGKFTKNQYKELTPEERKQHIAKASLGIALTSILYGMTKLPCKDGNNMLDITGGGTGDFGKDEQLRETGWKPYSIRVCGGNYYSYKYTPLNFNLSFIGFQNDREKYAGEEDGIYQMMGAMYQTGQLALDGTWVGSTSDLMKTLSEGNPKTLAANLQKTLANMATQAAVPNYYMQGAQYIEEWGIMNKKDAKGAFERVQQHIPVWRNGLNDKINSLGEPIKTDVDVFRSEYRPHKQYDYLTSKNVFVTPVNPNSFIVIDPQTNDERPGTRDEYYKFAQLRGDKIKGAIDELMENGTEVVGTDNAMVFKTAEELTTKELKKIMTTIKTKASKDAKKQLFADETSSDF